MLRLRTLLPVLCSCFALCPSPVSSQTARQRAGAAASGGAAAGHGAERIKVLFTPTICKVRCTQGRCTNFCERGNVTTLYNSHGNGQSAGGHGFRVFLCPMLCQNGGICIQKDRCICPPNFTGKFCQIPVLSSSTNDIEKTPPSPSMPVTEQLMQSEYILPLQNQQAGHASGAGLVKVRVQHPPEASVKIHQVIKVGHGPTAREQSETVTWSAGLSGARTSVLPGERAEAPPPIVQAQTIRGDATYTESSGFKYCFREVRNGQCSSPLPGLRSQETCCRGVGRAWGINDCTLCPGSCPKGFERINGTQCVDVNECSEPGICENGDCVNTRGSYTCVCRPGYLLDTSHGICISHKVISEEKHQCYRVVSAGVCSLPILKNITKQICCCSRVGKAWGRKCETCPFFGSAAFKEICPAGPGYHYSANNLQINQRLVEYHSTGQQVLVSNTGASAAPDTRPQQPDRINPQVPQARPHQPTSTGSLSPEAWPQQPTTKLFPFSHPLAVFRTQTGRPLVPATPRPHLLRPGIYLQKSQRSSPVCESRPQICGAGRCVDQPGGRHTCLCDPGHQLNAQRTQCQDIDECRQTPNPCSNSQCENTPGSYKCVCRTGFKRQGNSCIDVNECENALRCPGQECVNSHGSFRCVSCRPGFRLQNGKCADVDECRQTPSPCSNGQCENTLSSYRCVCHTGFRLQGNNCTGKTKICSTTAEFACNVNECIRTPPPCGGGVCENTLGSYRCATCQSGFKLLNGQCSDVNECVETPGICSNGRCENTPGSFRCACRNGYRQEGDRSNPHFFLVADVDECENALQCPGKECVNLDGSFQCVTCKPGFSLQNGQCQDVDECSQTPRVCANGRCKNAAGGYRCECYIGFQLQDNVCTDVDECQGPQVCGPESLCVNTDGSYHCECKPGYRALGQQCRDINECMEGEYCFPRGECINTKGSYRCQCAPGYRTGADGTSCLDEDECARPGVCQDGHCVNSEGSFQCRCQAGFTTNPEKTACLDVDECVDSEGAVCGTQRCENTIGSYRCFTSCEPGYRVTATGECVDVNECANETVCGKHSFCQNLIGTYQCMCDQGYVAAGDAGGCVDENECETMQGVCGTAHCENVEGSFMCDCPNPEEVFNPRTGMPFSGNSASLPPAKHGEVRQCYYNMADPSSCNVLAHNTTHQECCCTVGWGWGLECVYEGCPQLGTVEFQSLCPSGRGYVTTGHSAFSYRDVDECKLFDKEVCKNGRCVNNIPGYSCYCSSGFYYHNERLECVDNDECAVEEPPCLGGICINTMGSYYCTCEPPLVLDDSQQSCVNTTGLSVDDSLSVCWQHVTADLVCQRLLRGRQVTFSECCCQHGEAWSFSCALCPATDSGNIHIHELSHSLLSRSLSHTLSHQSCYSLPDLYYDEADFDPQYDPPRLAPLPDNSPYSEDGREERWRFPPPFPPFRDSRRGETPRRVFERRFESYEGLGADECGIVHGCENGRCIRVAEGYTCDCFTGYQLEMTSMACIDINECEEPDIPDCINGRCINTDGSYRCQCLVGFIMSRRPNYCIPA
uniref:Latent-transforming growth factor beta-binding protein 2 n=1 Tax=Denticeps clupeoides TaxID=299321 RepID=A0AAY4D5H5_9TELE